jgi:ubiquinone/menaquinone biosynthesis C-methylase UbiE
MNSADGGKSANAEMIEYWNDKAGPKWVHFQKQLDGQIGAIGKIAMDRAGVKAGDKVLDIGCGCGDSSLELARRAGVQGAVRGIDISAPMLAEAKRRAAMEPALKLEFEHIDAQTAGLRAAAYDHGFSRFGVMFFDDPVAAFANIRKSLKAGGRLTFVCWRGLDENPWMAIPLDVAYEFVAPPEALPPGAPGPFALADGDRAKQILDAAGYRDVALEALNEPLYLSGPGTAAAAAAHATRMGPVARVLADADEDTNRRVEAALAETLAPYHDGTGVRMASACWIISAAP